MTKRHVCRAGDGWHYCECSVAVSHGPDLCRTEVEGLPRFTTPVMDTTHWDRHDDSPKSQFDPPDAAERAAIRAFHEEGKP